ncbi:HNH endonuclease [Chryseobacterium rhizoplanae]|uniref:HNH endonuclease n=1 Tax=Chryseobacterium rhizoplanae TaxID=1609531 RepID=A0A521ER83_9FLAO|nr:HNH endonuclease domain-containing protein [Chryseobacterium rhizoplanae]SMO86407.1 HNH endonuclease [Chryseobacterium rhizoplanae]
MINIIPTKEAIDFHESKISIFFEKIISDGYILRNRKQKKLPDTFIRFLSDYKEDLISGTPQRLQEINEEFKKKHFSNYHKDLIKSTFIQTGYTNFQKNHAKEFLSKLNIDSCVYCNRNYTLDIVKNRTRAELDHWFPKESHYVLALSFYNLIPSCHSCNHIKHNNSPEGGWENAIININHPYSKDTNQSFTFNYILKDLKTPKTITRYNETNLKVKKTLDFNKTREIYDTHSDRELIDLYNLRYKYSDNYLKILIDSFQNFTTKHEAYKLLFGIEVEEKDYHKRPFSKFKKDIIDELLKNTY